MHSKRAIVAFVGKMAGLLLAFLAIAFVFALIFGATGV